MCAMANPVSKELFAALNDILPREGAGRYVSTGMVMSELRARFEDLGMDDEELKEFVATFAYARGHAVRFDTDADAGLKDVPADPDLRIADKLARMAALRDIV